MSRWFLFILLSKVLMFLDYSVTLDYENDFQFQTVLSYGVLVRSNVASIFENNDSESSLHPYTDYNTAGKYSYKLGSKDSLNEEYNRVKRVLSSDCTTKDCLECAIDNNCSWRKSGCINLKNPQWFYKLQNCKYVHDSKLCPYLYNSANKDYHLHITLPIKPSPINTHCQWKIYNTDVKFLKLTVAKKYHEAIKAHKNEIINKGANNCVKIPKKCLILINHLITTSEQDIEKNM